MHGPAAGYGCKSHRRAPSVRVRAKVCVVELIFTQRRRWFDSDITIASLPRVKYTRIFDTTLPPIHIHMYLYTQSNKQNLSLDRF